MKYKKSMIIIMFTIFLFAIASASAGDANDMIVASEDISQTDLYGEMVTADDNLQTDEKEQLMAQANNEVPINSNDNVTLQDKLCAEGEGTYYDLIDEIGGGGDKNLTKSYYRYTGGNEIEIATSGVINGNGAVIDMVGSDIRVFYVSASGVTIKNLTIKNANAYTLDGGAILFDNSGIVENCTFYGNSVLADGGAIYFGYSGTHEVINCNFINNAAQKGCAVYFFNEGKVTNCTFTNNSAVHCGAVYLRWYGEVTNCTFTNNSAPAGSGAIYMNFGSVENCNFADNTANNGEGGAIEISEGSVENCNFTNCSAGYGGAVSVSGNGNVTNCNFMGNNADYGGAVRLMQNGTITNCNFIASNAKYDGGVVYAVQNGTIANCNFTNCSAELKGGAVYMSSGSVENCNFADNTANNGDGGAVYMSSGSVENCNFTDNNVAGFRSYGGAVYFNDGGKVRNCNFAYNSARDDEVGEANVDEFGGGAVYMSSGSVENCNFTDNNVEGFKCCGGAVYFNNGGKVTNCNFAYNSARYDAETVPNADPCCGGALYFRDYGEVMDCNFADNNVACFVSCGGAVFFNNGGKVTNCNFSYNGADGHSSCGGAVSFGRSTNGTVTNCSFTNNKAGGGEAIFFDYSSSGCVINCNFTNNQTGKSGAIFFGNECNGTVVDCNFVNAATRDGAILFGLDCNGTVVDCNFVKNAATDGGAIRFYSGSNGTVVDCNFVNNTAIKGGAILFSYNCNGAVTNCNFTGNNAYEGSAIYLWETLSTISVSNSCFLNNRANAAALEIIKNDNNVTIAFKGNDNLLNAIYSEGENGVTFNNVTYWGAEGISNTDSSTPLKSKNEAGQNITVYIVVNDVPVLNEVKVTDANGMIVLDISAGESYLIGARHNTDSYYTEVKEAILNNTKFNVNVTSKTTSNRTVNITVESDIPNEFVNCELLIIVQNTDPITANYAGNGIWWAVHTFDDYAVYKVNATYSGLDDVEINNATITINKANSTLTLNNIAFEYKGSGSTAVSFKGATGVKAKVLNQPKAKVIVKNNKITVSGLNIGTYTLSVTTIPDSDHNAVTKNVKIKVNKIKTKITAKKKTFKTKIKTKKYVITLKDSKGNAIKNAKVTLKVKGKLFKANTNKKGQATFKLTKLTKKGKYTAVVKFAGNKCYNAKTVKPKITVK